MSGAQVSPTEIENVLLAQPEKLIFDVTVAGVSGGRTSDEKVPRAWVVMSDEGKQRGAEAVVQALHTWIQKNLSKYKWLRGGIEVVEEVRHLLACWDERLFAHLRCIDSEEPYWQGAATCPTGSLRAAAGRQGARQAITMSSL